MDTRRRLIQSQKIHIDPNQAPDGVYILHTDGQLYFGDKWNISNSKAVGVAIIKSGHRFVIDPKFSELSSRWSGDKIIVPGVPVVSLDEANTDFGGMQNTNALKDQYGEYLSNGTQNYAFQRCIRYRFENKKYGYLGASGEWWIAFYYKSIIDEYMSKIGGVSIPSRVWTSTQLGERSAICLNWDEGRFFGADKTDPTGSNAPKVRPLCQF